MRRDVIKDIIRSKLKAFVTRREHAYKAIIHSGITVPDYATKARAIEVLKIQIEASKSWTLEAHLRWIHVMHDEITALLPYEFHDDPKQKIYRKHMLDLLNYCEDLLNSKTNVQLFKPLSL